MTVSVKMLYFNRNSLLDVFCKKVFFNFFKNPQNCTSAGVSWPVILLKRNSDIFLWILQNFKNIFFPEHVWMTASVQSRTEISCLIFSFYVDNMKNIVPSLHLLVQNKQWKHQSNKWNQWIVRNEYTRTTSHYSVLFWTLANST